MALLRDVHAAVPTAPNLRGVEHAAATGLIAEGGLASAVGASARRARNTSNSAASAPRLRSGVVADLVLHGVGLAVILGDIGVDVADEVRTEGTGQGHGHRHRARLHGRVVELVDGHNGSSSRHL